MKDFKKMKTNDLLDFIARYYEGFAPHDRKNNIYLSEFEEAIREITKRELKK